MTLTHDVVRTICKTKDKVRIPDDSRPKLTMNQIRSLGPGAEAQPIVESSYLPADIRKIVSAYNRLLAETMAIANHARNICAERGDVYRLRSAFVAENSIKAIDKKFVAMTERIDAIADTDLSMTLRDLVDYVRERSEFLRVSCHMIYTYHVLHVKDPILGRIRSD